MRTSDNVGGLLCKLYPFIIKGKWFADRLLYLKMHLYRIIFLNVIGADVNLLSKMHYFK